MGGEEDVSGLPWGSFNMQYIVARGHASASQQGSRRASDQRVDEARQYLNPFGESYGQVASFDSRDSSGDDAIYFEESPYFYEFEHPAPDNEDGHGHQSWYVTMPLEIRGIFMLLTDT